MCVCVCGGGGVVDRVSACLCVYLCVYMRACAGGCVCVYLWLYMCVAVCLCVYLCINMSVCICMSVCLTLYIYRERERGSKCRERVKV